MDHEKPRVFQRRHASGRQPRQVTQVGFLQAFARQRPGDAGEILVAGAAVDDHVLGGAVVVVAANGVARLLAHPGDARGRFQGVVHQVAEEQANIVRFRGDRLQRRPIGVNVRDEKDAHEPPSRLGNSAGPLT